MAKSPSFQFYPGDWLRNDVSGCSLEAQGLWLRMMMVMHDAQIYGQLVLNNQPMSVEFLAKKVGTSVKRFNFLLKELDAAGVVNRHENGVIHSGRMERDEHERQVNRERQKNYYDKNHGKPNGIPNGDSTPIQQKPNGISNSVPNAKPNGASSSSSSTSTKEEEDKRGDPPPAKPTDPRKVHPAIVGVWKTTGKYPPKDIWDELIDFIGEDIDEVKLKKCWVKWRAKGFNPTNYAWALEWYIDGIPEQRNGTNRSNNTSGRATSTDRLKAHAGVVEKYATQAELDAAGKP